MNSPSKILLLLALLKFAVQTATGGTFVLPLGQTNHWQFLKYRNIQSNTFRSTRAGLVVGVTNSAAPAVFPLTNELRVVGLKVSGTISGSLNIRPSKQGQEGFDDYALRVGLVEAGTHRLRWRERILAADWVKKLFALAPPGTGIGGIQFFNVGTDGSQIGRSMHLSDKVSMDQTVETVPNHDGHFAFTIRFRQALDVIAIWISCDGDDTDSNFAVTLEQVDLETAAK